MAEHRASKGTDPVVLDIGAGTGLLSMMAARAGAKHVYACEVFKPLAELASQITAANTPGKVTVIGKLSTHLSVGVGSVGGGEGEPATDTTAPDLPERADLLVSEILDSVLIGEGVLPFIRQARADLVKPGAAVLPKGAVVYAQVVQHQGLRECFDLSEAHWHDDLTCFRDEQAAKCTGGRLALPMHVSELTPAPIHLTDAVPVMRFDLTQATEARPERYEIEVAALTDGRADAVLFWWDLNVWGDIVYSTRPGAENWQDHWVQCAYPLPSKRILKKGETVTLVAHRNDTTVWFSLAESDLSSAGEHKAKRPRSDDDQQEDSNDDVAQCTCGWHTLCNTDRILMLNDRNRTEKYTSAIRSIGSQLGARLSTSTWLDVSDGSFLSLLTAAVHKTTGPIVSLEAKEFSMMLSMQIAEANKATLGGRVTVVSTLGSDGGDDEEADDGLYDVLMAEPFFYQMQNLPVWEATSFWYLRTALSAFLRPGAVVMPRSASIWAVAVEFEHLWSNFGPAGDVEGFDHSLLDKLHGNSLRPLAYPLWMYPYRPLTEEFQLCTFDYSQEVSAISAHVALPVIESGAVHGLVIWVDFNLDGRNIESTRARHGSTPAPYKQSVQFVNAPITVGRGQTVVVTAEMPADSASLEIAFTIK